jgi:hypothetical protein
MPVMVSYAPIAALSLVVHEMQFSTPPSSAKLRHGS